VNAIGRKPTSITPPPRTATSTGAGGPARQLQRRSTSQKRKVRVASCTHRAHTSAHGVQLTTALRSVPHRRLLRHEQLIRTEQISSPGLVGHVSAAVDFTEVRPTP